MTQLYSVQYSSKQYKGPIPFWAIVANYFWACNSVSIAPVECKPGNNTGIIGNFESIIGSFWGNKE